MKIKNLTRFLFTVLTIITFNDCKSYDEPNIDKQSIIAKYYDSPFYMKIGEMTREELINLYNVELVGGNIYSGGVEYLIDIKDVNFPRLKKLVATFDKTKKLVSIIATFPQEDFYSLYDSLKSKYASQIYLVESANRRLFKTFIKEFSDGSKEAKYVNHRGGNNMKIILQKDAKYSNTVIAYFDKKYYENLQLKKKEEEKAANQRL